MDIHELAMLITRVEMKLPYTTYWTPDWAASYP